MKPSRVRLLALSRAALLGVLAVGLVAQAAEGPSQRPNVAVAAKATGGGKDDPLPGYEIVRCLLSEKRLVVRKSGKLTVVHEGERLPGSDIQVTKFSPSEVSLEQGKTVRNVGGKPVTIPSRLILLSIGPDGRPSFRVFSDHDETSPPAVLTRSETAIYVPGQGTKVLSSGPSPSEAQPQPAKAAPPAAEGPGAKEP